jgi:hypothetical protein
VPCLGSVANYDTNPALNVSINGIDIAELGSAAGYNDALRQIMADIKAWTECLRRHLSDLDSPMVARARSTAAAGLGSVRRAVARPIKRLPQVAKSAAFDFDRRWTAAMSATPGPPRLRRSNATPRFPRDAVIVIVNDGSGGA